MLLNRDPEGTVMGTTKQNIVVACKSQEATEQAKPTTTFSGRTDVDASQLVKTPRAKKVLEQLRRSKSEILSHAASKRTGTGSL
jgi:hypothetical protein